ncbi:response regulator transcription factor [Gordonia sp. CPCC 206044]|uniref:response regulator n=1 Tax=Gordonia sp. CPCC 206044 TaxID=3140793 RepID=UPI003AF35694
MASEIRVLLADDLPLVRSGFGALLDAEDDIAVVAQGGDGAEAISLARAHHPDVAILDIRMPGTDGLTATRTITADPDLADVKVLILTTFELDEYVFEAVAAGASGFLVKHTEPDELIRAVRVIAAGDALLSPSVTRRLISRFTSSTPPPDTPSTPPDTGPAASLTERETDVVRLVADGLSNEEIAQRWVVSNATVRTHVSRAMTKLAARDRAQLVVFAYRLGLATPPRT